MITCCGNSFTGDLMKIDNIPLGTILNVPPVRANYAYIVWLPTN